MVCREPKLCSVCASCNEERAHLLAVHIVEKTLPSGVTVWVTSDVGHTCPHTSMSESRARDRVVG